MQRPWDGMAAAAEAAKVMNMIKSSFARSGLFSIQDLFDVFFSRLNLCLGQIIFSITLMGLMLR